MNTTSQSPNERDVRNRNFVFFGGSAGIGRAAALELARRGADVLIVGRSQQAGENTVAALQSAGAANATFLAGDLSTVAGMSAVAAGVRAWRPYLHGVMHTAMAAFHSKQITSDGFEFAFALQYLARAALNRLLIDRLAASGDGRIVHIAGDVPAFFTPNLDDLQFERRRWSFFKSVLGTHRLGFLHIQEAARRWQLQPVSITAVCVGSTKTKAMADPAMPFVMRLMGWFGTSPEHSAANAVRVLTAAEREANGAILRNPTRYRLEPITNPRVDAERLWDLTTRFGHQRGLELP